MSEELYHLIEKVRNSYFQEEPSNEVNKDIDRLISLLPYSASKSLVELYRNGYTNEFHITPDFLLNESASNCAFKVCLWEIIKDRNDLDDISIEMNKPSELSFHEYSNYRSLGELMYKFGPSYNLNLVLPNQFITFL